MDTGAAECRLACFLIIRILTRLTETLFHLWILYYLYSNGYLIWFAVCTGIVFVSIISEQLVSMQIRNDFQKQEKTGWVFVISHVLLAGQLWRYGRLAISSRIAITQTEIWQCFAVNLLHVFTCSFPMACIIILHRH